MSDDIIQRMGFDASQAIDSLKKVDSAFASFNATLQQTAKTIALFNKDATGVVSALKEVQGAASGVKFPKEVAQNIKDTKRNTDQLTVSMRLLSRIVYTQAIVRGLSILRDAFREMAAEAVAFQRKVAEIKTIAGGQTFEQLAGTVREFSDSFNLPLMDAAAGLYQTLSNQVGNVAESMMFMAEAAKFAKATGSTQFDAVDLLSGAMKSYGMEVEETDRIASTFFKTIELGRVTATELANTFGRVGPQAAALGIDFQELNAAIAAISVKGNKAPETLTQVRNIMVALQKPTVAMRQALADLGFTSSETAIRTLGFGNTLSALYKSTNGSAEALAKLFPNIRGLTGETSLAVDGFESMKDAFEEIKAAGDDLNQRKFLEATATDAERVTKELNQIRNALTTGLGQELLVVSRRFADWAGGAKSIVPLIESSGAALVGAGASAVMLAGTMKIIGAEAKGFALAMRTGLMFLGSIPVALGAGSSIASWFNSNDKEEALSQLRSFADTHEKIMKRVVETEEYARDSIAQANKEMLRQFTERNIETTKAYQQQRNAIQAADTAMVANVKANVNNIIEARRRLVDELTKQLDKARQIQAQFEGRVLDIRDQRDAKLFEMHTRTLDDAKKSMAMLQRAQQLSSQASRLLLTAGTNDGQADRARGLFEQAQRYLEEARSTAEDAGRRDLARKAELDLLGVMDDQAAAEARLGKAQVNIIAGLEKRRTLEQDLLEHNRAAASELYEKLSGFTKDGIELSPVVREQNIKDVERLSQALAQSALSLKDIDALSALGLNKQLEQLRVELRDNPIKLIDTRKGVTAQAAEIKASLDLAFSDYKVKLNFDVTGLEALLGTNFANPDQVIHGLNDLTTKLAEFRRERDALLDDQRSLDFKRAELASLMTQMDRFNQEPGTFADDSGVNKSREFAIALRDIATQANLSDVSLAQLKASYDALVQFQRGDSMLTGWIDRLNFSDVTHQAAEAVRKVLEIRNLQQQMEGKSLVPLTQSIQQYENILSGLNSSGASFSANTLESAKAMAEVRANAVSAGAALERGAAAIQAAADAQTRARVQSKAHGGLMRYFASGGQARGIDTIPAMLSAGEFVVNARSARRFYGQLQAINAGQQPVYREAGGSVTNVGDISINVRGGETAQQTARAISQELRREIRRGITRF